MSESLLEALDWDSNHFGFPVARVSVPTMDPDAAIRIRKEASAREIRCVYFLAHANDEATWGNACRVGFEPIDIRVELSRRVPDPAALISGHFSLAQESDLSDLLTLSTDETFADSRFARDARFPRPKVRELFQLWVRRGMEDGFVLCSRNAEDGAINAFVSGSVSGRQGRIELLSVLPAAQGQGLGKRLVTSSLAEFARRGAEEVSVVTQGANLAAQRAYQNSGFTTRACGLWFHLWLH